MYFFAPTAVFTNSSGTSAQEGGGVYIYNYALFGGVNTIQTNGTRIGGSTFTNPVQVKIVLFLIGKVQAYSCSGRTWSYN